jgi:glycosyltransferase involved in cell wall biosynthesis
MGRSIKFYVNEVAGGWSPQRRRLGGTEESIVQWAERLAKRGHTVTVYKNGEVMNHNGVTYRDRSDYEADDGVTICVKDSELIPEEHTLYLTNEVDADLLDLSLYDGVIWPSQWATDNIPVNNDNIHILPHGYDKDRIMPDEKLVNSCLYASSPDRGLDEILKVWPQVVEAVPEAHLAVTYGARGEGKNVTFLDATEPQMDILFGSADIWVHPCTGGELFGITGIKAQVAQCVPVYYPTMALSETVKHGIQTTSDKLAEDLIAIMNDEERKTEIRNKLAKQHYVDWEESTDILEGIIGI